MDRYNDSEKGCKWYFVPEAKNHQKLGFQGLEELFRMGGVVNSLVREILQNSVDARKDKSQPVRVAFTFETVSKNNFPELFNLSAHVEQCRESENDKNICNAILEVLNTDTISYLKVSDFNTTGLIDQSIQKIVYSTGYGRDASEAGKGGAFGYGHNAYIAASKIRSFLVSSYDEKGCWSFAGLTALKSHRFNKQDVSSYGYYSSKDNGDPLSDYDEIPAKFRREAEFGFGTDVFILGFDENDDGKQNIVESVLANFWMAIYREILIVEIGDTVINKETLDDLLKEHFSEGKVPVNSVFRNRRNPLPAYMAVVNIDKNEEGYDKSKYRYYEGELEHIGRVKLYFNINRKDNNNKHVEYMRSPLMLIKSARLGNNIHYNFSALFLCDNEIGDGILRRMESPSHDDWKKENIRDNDEVKRMYADIPSSIKSFIRDKLNDIFESDNADTIHIDLGNLLNPFLTKKSASVTSQGGREKGSVENDKVKKRSKIEKTIRSGGYKDVNGTPGEGPGNILTGRGSKKIKSGGGKPHPGDGSNSTDFNTEGNGSVGYPVEIDYEAIAIIKNDQVWHRIYIIPKESCEKCFIYLGIGTDVSDYDKNVVIKKASGRNNSEFNVDGNKIKDIELKANEKTIIDVRFSDNIKHTISVKPFKYE